jgi:hypothetical protein
MKKLCIVAVTLLFACGGEEKPVTASCRPVVDVIALSGKASKGGSAPVRTEVVQVYWDVSQSMRDFAELAPVVAALDSSVLLRAHANAVEQYGVGESIAPLPSARAALHPSASRTVLHLAAEKIGTALASGSAEAAIVVSDMELDTPPRGKGTATVCGGVPLPSSPAAGSLFGRCFENAVLASDDAARTRRNLLAHVFRKSTKGRELFILLLATDRAFGRRISDEVVSRLDFERQVIFDSGDVAAANVRGCSLTVPAQQMLRTSSGCGAKCFEPDAVIQAECDLRRPANGAWIYPAGRGIDGASYESLKKKPGQTDEQAVVRFAIPCSTPPGRFNAVVSFTWQQKTPSAFAAKASVRDLFDSLSDAIVRTVAPRRLRIGIDLAK